MVLDSTFDFKSRKRDVISIDVRDTIEIVTPLV